MKNWLNLQRRELQAEEKLEIHRVVSDIINRNIMIVLMHLKIWETDTMNWKKSADCFFKHWSIPQGFGQFLYGQII